MIETFQNGMLYMALSCLMLMFVVAFVFHIAMLIFKFWRYGSTAAKTRLQKFAVSAFVLLAISVGGTKPDDGDGDNNDSGLINLLSLVYYPQAGVEYPVPIPISYGDDDVVAIGFKETESSFWFSYQFSQSFTIANDTLEIYVTHKLPFVDGVLIVKVPIWPNVFGVVFEISKEDVFRFYHERYPDIDIKSLFFNAHSFIDTDNDGRSDAEETLVTKTSVVDFSYDDDPPFPVGEKLSQDTIPMLLSLDPEEFADGRECVTSITSNLTYRVDTAGYYQLWATADDLLNVSVGPLSVSAYWSMEENRRIEALSDPAWFNVGEYDVSYHFEDYGGESGHDYELKPAVVTNCVPTFTLTTNVVEVIRGSDESIPPAPEVIITHTIEGDKCAHYTTSEETNPDLNGEWFKKITYHYFQGNEDRGSDTCTYKYAKGKDKKKKCTKCCTEGTTCTNGCVSVSQNFGRSPRIPGLPEGQIVVEEAYPTSRLFSNAALKFDHPMMREIVSNNGYDAIIKDGLGELIEYKDGKPANFSGGLDTYLYHDGTNYIERLSSDLEVIYSRGKVAYLNKAYGKRIPVSELGITINRDDNGNIASIVSIADGIMSTTNLTAQSWRLNWTKLDGTTPIKRFTFTCANSGDVSLEEWRNEDFNFNYHWVYDSAADDWHYERGTGSEALGITKSREYNSTTKRWNIVEQTVDATSNVVTSTSLVLDMSGNAAMTIGSSDSIGHSLYSATRDEHGFIQTETNEKGGTTVYSRDNFGRVISKIEPYADTHTKTTIYSYAPGSRHRYDTRPIRKIVKLDGTTILHEEYEYAANRKDTYRAFDLDVRHSFVEYDDYGREVLNVKENGRARRTAYDGLYELREEGVYSSAFELVDGKSTRTELYKSAAGNVTNEVEYAYVEGAWRELSSKTMTYDAAHRVTSTTYSNGKTSAAEYICTGPVWTRDEEGIVVSNEYNSVKALKKSTRFGPHGAVETRYTYDGAGRVVSETRSAADCETQTHTYAYDSRGRIVSETGFDGKTITTTYSGDDKVTTRTFADGGTEVTTVASDGTLISITGTAVIAEYYTYGVTDFGETWTRVDYGMENSPKYKVTYKNAYGEVIRIERSGFGEEIVDRFTYNHRGELIKETSTGKPDKTYEYNEWGEQTMMIESADGVARYNQASSSNAVIDGEVYSVRSTSISADGIAAICTTNKVQVSNLSPDTESARESIDKHGKYRRELSSFDPTNSVRYVASSYEAVSNNAYQTQVDGLVTESISESAVTNRFEYNAYGWRTAAIDGRGNRTSYEYDERGNLIRETDAAGGMKSYGYDSMNHMIVATNEVGNVTTYSYDTLGRTVYEGGSTYPVRYGFDQYGNQTTMTTYRSETAAEGGGTTTWVCDVASGLITQKLYADGHGPSYTYTSDGKLLSRTWARGVTTYYAYDGFGNLTSITYSDDTPSITFTYDALGRVTSITDASGTTTYSYNEYGDEIGVSHTGLYEKILEHHFDVYGRNLGHTLDGSRKNNIEYDSATGRIRRVQLGGAWYTWDYLPGTDLKSSLSIGTAGTTTWEYEPNRDLLTSVTHHFFDSDISTYTYANDAAGRRTSKNGEAYGYNERDELTSVTTNSVSTYSYNYDDIGNRVSSSELGEARTYAANSLNQYIGDDYDLDGNQTNIVTTTGTWAVIYNAENRPVNWQCGTTNIVMKYDYMGRRVEYLETVASEWDDSSIVTNAHHKFVYDGYLQLQRLNGSDNSVDLSFEWDPTEPIATRPLFMQTHSTNGSQSFFFTHDGNKNVSDVVSYQQARGVVAHYDYAPFGAVTSATGSLASINPFRFSSEYHDDTFGLVYYNYRHYNPQDGRWVNRDVMEELGACNLYIYAGNRIAIDYLGMKECDRVGNFRINDLSVDLIPAGTEFKQEDVLKDAEQLLMVLAKIGLKSVSSLRPTYGSKNSVLTSALWKVIASEASSGISAIQAKKGESFKFDFKYKYIYGKVYRVEGRLLYDLCQCQNGDLRYVKQTPITDFQNLTFGNYDTDAVILSMLEDAVKSVEYGINHYLTEELKNAD